VVRFHVCRTRSQHDDDDNPVSPCEGAFRAPYVRVDRRTFKTEAEHDSNGFIGRDGKPDLWRDQGSNHRTWEGGICRDFDDEDWFIEIDDVIAFMRKHGRLVIGPWFLSPEIISIEIYDDYRE